MEEIIYNYVFHYNPITKTWAAVPRDRYLEYWSNPKDKTFLRSSSIKTLTELIIKGDKFIKSIQSKSRTKK